MDKPAKKKKKKKSKVSKDEEDDEVEEEPEEEPMEQEQPVKEKPEEEEEEVKPTPANIVVILNAARVSTCSNVGLVVNIVARNNILHRYLRKILLILRKKRNYVASKLGTN